MGASSDAFSRSFNTSEIHVWVSRCKFKLRKYPLPQSRSFCLRESGTLKDRRALCLNSSWIAIRCAQAPNSPWSEKIKHFSMCVLLIHFLADSLRSSSSSRSFSEEEGWHVRDKLLRTGGIDNGFHAQQRPQTIGFTLTEEDGGKEERMSHQ